eukprot:15456873-Alexandrium_andersonii.AAC.1
MAQCFSSVTRRSDEAGSPSTAGACRPSVLADRSRRPPEQRLRRTMSAQAHGALGVTWGCAPVRPQPE